ncbi:MAG: hypothetical protein ABSC89_00910 [Verrucomicrobiota bacterium]|jgi:hypothetical protein
MGFGGWLAENSVRLLTAAAGIGGLWFAAYSIHEEAKARRVANLLAITANHREIWNTFLNNKELARVRDASANIIKQPITEAEKTFVASVIAHINSVFYAMNNNLVINLDGLRRDVAQFLSLPIPREVWERIKPTQNDDFVAFVESCRNWK